MDANGLLLNKGVEIRSIVARVEKIVLFQTGKFFKNSGGEVELPNERLIKITESSHSRFIQQRHSLPGNELNHETLDDTKRYFPPSSREKRCRKGMPSRPSALSGTALAKRHIVRIGEIAKAERKRNQVPGGMASNSSEARAFQRQNRSGIVTPALKQHFSFSHWDAHILSTNSKPKAACRNVFKAMIMDQDEIIIRKDPGFSVCGRTPGWDG